MMQQGGGGDKPTKYQIWYTTSDNSQITGTNFASDTGLYGETINPVVTHTFNNGVWVITFQYPVIATAVDSAFRRNTKLQSVTFPHTLQIVGRRSFGQCTNLLNVYFNNSQVEVIRSSAFEVCTSLTDLDLPESIVEIGDSAFTSCRAIGGLTLPKNLTIIGASAFSSCTNLVVAEIPANVTSIGGTAFRYSNNVRNVKILRTTSMIIATGALMFVDSCVISVPNALLSQYQNDTNWNRYTLIVY